MSQQSFEQGWLSGHEAAAFPFREKPDIASDPIPSGFLVDLRLFLSGYKEVDAYLKTVSYDEPSDSYTLEFAFLSNATTILQGTLTRLNIDGSSRVFQKQHIAEDTRVGLFSPGSKWDEPSWGGAGSWTKNFQTTDSLVETTQVLPGPQTLRRIFIDGEAIPPRHEWPTNVNSTLVAGYNLEFGQGDSRVPVNPLLNQGDDSFIELNCGAGIGAGFPPAESTTPLGYVARFNGKAVSNNGNVTIAMADCLRIFQPKDETETIIPHTLQMASDCAPCCPCGEYRKVVRAEDRRSAKIKDECDKIAQILIECAGTYNDAVDTINKKRPPIVVVRNVRVLGSQAVFTVANITNTPVYAYLAFNVVSSASPLGAPVLAGGQSHLTPVSQVGHPQVYPAINVHRTTVLPPLAFDPAENPLAGFPTEKFSDELGQLLFAVGKRSAENAFGPIPSGTTVEVAINFPDVAAQIAALAPIDTPAKQQQAINISLAGRLPRFKFRSVGVYGASHSYPCAGETYEVLVEEYQRDRDITDDICAIRLEGNFQVTTMNQAQ